MEFVELPGTVIEELLKAPETGMGYQRGSLVRDQRERTGFFISGSHFIPEESEDLSGPIAKDFSKFLMLRSPQPTQTAAEVFHKTPKISLRPIPTALSSHVALPQYTSVTSASDVFYRVSAFKNDRRILSDGRLRPGSYSTTDTDITVVPNGLAAVGRYALPIRMSARHVFEIRPGAGVKILFGTVTPNYGLAGGGVEVYFPTGTGPNTAKWAKQLPEK